MRLLFVIAIRNVWCVAALILVSLASPGRAQPEGTTPKAPSARNDASADKSWEQVLQDSEPLDVPEEWLEKPAGPSAIAQFHRRSSQQAGKAAEVAREFFTRFPDHPKAARARLLEAELLATSVHLGAKDRVNQLRSAEEALQPDEDARFGIRSAGVQRIAYYLQFAGYMANLDEFEKDIRALRREYPRRVEPFELLSVLAKNRFYEDQIKEARRVAEELAASGAPGDIIADAKAMVQRFNQIDRPVRFQFTALDGREVNLEKLPGKVVLIDCWATWCPPCIREIPKLTAIYRKYHDKGFEIVGISSDDDKAALEKFVLEKRMPWPQFFDGKGEANRFATEFHITGVPTLWLLDKKGVLRQVNALLNIESKIERLLAE